MSRLLKSLLNENLLYIIFSSIVKRLKHRIVRNYLFRLAFSGVVFSSLVMPGRVENLRAAPYLEDEEILAVAAASMGIVVLGHYIKKSAGSKEPRWSSALPLEHSLQSLLGGDCSVNKSNFLDGTGGSMVTPINGGVILVLSNLAWPRGAKGKDASQDLFLYLSGLTATKGVTDIVKGLVRRERPLPCLEPGIASQREEVDYGFDQQSFFSGHTSSAFFAMAFVNIRVRSIMRQELTADEYRDWRWASPALFYSWASVVGWSRIHAYRHFFTDVLAGAAAGILMAELFHSFQNEVDINRTNQSNASPPMIRLTFPF